MHLFLTTFCFSNFFIKTFQQAKHSWLNPIIFQKLMLSERGISLCLMNLVNKYVQFGKLILCVQTRSLENTFHIIMVLSVFLFVFLVFYFSITYVFFNIIIIFFMKEKIRLSMFCFIFAYSYILFKFILIFVYSYILFSKEIYLIYT